jgi:queuine tRNA-ribosyltransferase
MSYNLLSSDGLARRGTFTTHHGTFDTPNFMPVGTRATVKGVDCERLAELGTQITLVNTYHLWLRPGEGLVSELGGIHSFCNWSGPILSDSGGFQIFSLKGMRRLTDEGVHFQSHIDGSSKFLSPEGAIKIQETLGVDIAMVLDECPAADLTHAEVARSLDLTMNWAARCLGARSRRETQLFGITQGGMHKDLRTSSAQALCEMPFDGYAIGGLSVGEEKTAMYDVLSYHPQQLPSESIRYLMGVGTPQDIVFAVAKGVDLFDCVMPTRSGRFGRAFVDGDKPFINIKNSQYRKLYQPLMEGCDCVTCRNYSSAYIHHLFRVDEMLGPQLVSIHNLRYYLRLMHKIRAAIEQGTFGLLFENEMKRWPSV